MPPKRDFIESALSAANSLLPMNAETQCLIDWLDEPNQVSRLHRLSIETGEDEPVDAFLEAIAMELDAGAVPALDDKPAQHQINWDHIKQHLRRSAPKMNTR